MALFLALTCSISLWIGESSSAPSERPVADRVTAATTEARMVHLRDIGVFSWVVCSETARRNPYDEGPNIAPARGPIKPPDRTAPPGTARAGSMVE